MTDRGTLESTIGEIYRARDADDIDALMNWVDPACSFRIVGTGRLGPTTQKVDDCASLRATLMALMENWDLTGVGNTGLCIEGDTVFVHRAGTVRFIPTDTRFDTEFVDKFTFRNGRVVELTEFVDTLSVAEAAGLVAPESAQGAQAVDLAPAYAEGIHA
jgi:ketosteroid isomerase-like protein